MSGNSSVNKKAKIKRADVITWRLCILFVLTVGFIIFLMSMQGSKFELALHTDLRILGLASAALFAGGIACLAVYFAKKKNGEYKSEEIVSLSFAFGTLFALAAGLILFYPIVEAKWLIIASIIALALCFIYYVYKKEFFILSALYAAIILFFGLPGAYVFPAGGLGVVINLASWIAPLLLALAAVIMTLMITMGKGDKFSVSKKAAANIREYTFFVTGVATVILSILRGFSAIGGFASYCVLIALYFIFALIYTADMTK